MVHEWYYGRGDTKSGPFSSKQLVDLATHGVVMPSDTVWRSGVTDGVLASKVKNLFAKNTVAQAEPVAVTKSNAPTNAPLDNWPGLLPLSALGVLDEMPAKPVEAPTASVDTLVSAGELPGLMPLSPLGVLDPVEPVEPVAAPPVVVPPPPPMVRKARAIAGKGCLIIGQDGKTVKFKGKCSTCKYEASSYQSITIPRGAYRTTFFCNKCRKQREVELQGMQ